ncbi:hypothetical protein BDR05DRAFT_551977 [Suillus weaverae]|nr:hypothetical protein BDR05DRAFT_551977 [Suillus weaverae]
MERRSASNATIMTSSYAHHHDELQLKLQNTSPLSCSRPFCCDIRQELFLNFASDRDYDLLWHRYVTSTTRGASMPAWQSSSSKQNIGQPSAPTLLGDAETDDAKATMPARAIAEEKHIVCEDVRSNKSEGDHAFWEPVDPPEFRSNLDPLSREDTYKPVPESGCCRKGYQRLGLRRSRSTK